MDISKETLMKAAGGQMEAFEHVYKVASGFVYNIALRITRNTEDAQEVTQDVFIKIHRNLKNFQFQSSFKTWVYRIAVNTSINAYKRRSREILRRVDYETTVKTVAAPETEKTVDKQDNEMITQSLLEVLNPDQRVCIVLREIQGLSYEEIADTLKININTVRSRLKRARETLLAYGKKRGALK